MRRAFVTAICAAALGVLGAAPAQAAFDDPLFFYVPQGEPPSPLPPPAGYLDGPCGLAVSASGQVYVSDYYHRSVDRFEATPAPSLSYNGQPLSAWSGAANPHTGPVDDPCGLDLDSAGNLYLNDYHREVVRFPAPLSLASAEVLDSGDPSDPYANPTGVAVDPATDHAFVDDRTYVAEYDAAGSFVRKIGEASLGDAYGIAVSGYGGTAGNVYVPDAESDTVKVFDTSFSTTTPKATIAGPPGGFGSLQDSAVAVDDASGEVYVADTLGPQFSEEPEAVVYVFGADGTYAGRLKHATIAAAPVGLAVDNSGTATQSRVYLTSGISEDAGIYAYPPGAATSSSTPPLGGSGAAGGASLPAGPASAAASPDPQDAGATVPPGVPEAAFSVSAAPGTASMRARRAAARKRRKRAARRRASHRRHHRKQAHRAGKDRR